MILVTILTGLVPKGSKVVCAVMLLSVFVPLSQALSVFNGGDLSFST